MAKQISAALLLAAAALVLPSPAESQARWQYVTDSSEGVLYFMRNRRTYGDMTLAEFKTEEDPDGRNGEASVWTQAVNCKIGHIKGHKGWHKPLKNTVGEDWYEAMCANPGKAKKFMKATMKSDYGF